MGKLFLIILLTLYALQAKPQSWQVVPGGSLNGDVYSMIRFGGYLWVSGTFGQAGPVSSVNVVRHDGTQWISTPTTNGVAFGFCIHNAELYALGGFNVGPIHYGVMKWNGVGWTPMAQLLSSHYFETGASYNGELVAGGRFTEVDGVPAICLAKYNGVVWSPFTTGLTNCSWTGLAGISGLYNHNGYLYTAGFFDIICGVNASCGAKWTGTFWEDLNIGINTSSSNFTSYQGNVYICGGFQNAGPASSQAIGKEDTVLGEWARVSIGNPGVMMNGLTMSVWNGLLYIAGNQDTGPGINIGLCGYWNGTSWTPDHQGLNSPSLILSLYTDPVTNVLYAGGTFNTQIGDTADYIVCKSNSPLPIELANFKAKCDERNNCSELTWSTYSEHDNQGFVVERSTDGFTFSVIGMIVGHGTTNVSQAYEYCDNYDYDGTIFYRLKQVDYDGEETLLGTRSISCDGKKKEGIEIQGSDIVIETETSGEFELRNALGEMILRKCVTKDCRISFETLMRGSYIALWKSGENIVSKKFVR